MALIEVFPEEYKRGGQEDILETRKIYTDLVIAARIRKGAGYLGRYAITEPDIDPDEVVNTACEVARAAAEEAKNENHVSLWLTGCAPEHRWRTEITEVREQTPAKLRADGFTRIRELWIPDEDHAIDRAALRITSANFTAPLVHMDKWHD